jgi:predicted house-cleaning noncanonical NTP pyrophosphatase (MazG superfamily)
MDIRSAQKIAWDTTRTEGDQVRDTTLMVDLIKEEMVETLDALEAGRREVSGDLAAITINLLKLAGGYGVDLQDIVEAKLAVSEFGAFAGQGKLVRDKIPQIIRSKGQEPVTCIADNEEYHIRLRAKLREEVEEFLASDNDREELADILEVLYALAGQAGTDKQGLEQLRAVKAEERGGFADRIIWYRNRPAAVQDVSRAAAKL